MTQEQTQGPSYQQMITDLAAVFIDHWADMVVHWLQENYMPNASSQALAAAFSAIVPSPDVKNIVPSLRGENPLHPVAMQLAQVMGVNSAAPMASMAWLLGTLSVHPAKEQDFDHLKRLLTELGTVAQQDQKRSFQQAVVDQSLRRSEQALSGMQHYREHPFRPDRLPCISLHAIGETHLCIYPQKDEQSGPIRPVLLIPSMINGAEIFDLTPERSLIRHLLDAGYSPYVINWGEPQGESVGYSVDDYIEKRLSPLFEYLVSDIGAAVPVMGYCMGGTLAAALACLHPQSVKGLAVLAAPWDFKAAPDHPAALHYQKFLPFLQNLCGDRSETSASPLSAQINSPQSTSPQSTSPQPISIEMLQHFFVSLNPAQSERKFRKFSQMDDESNAAHLFIALERWANMGAAVAAPVIRQAVDAWFDENLPAKGLWTVAGKMIDPCQYTGPTFVVSPQKDSLVPPESSAALALAMTRARNSDNDIVTLNSVTLLKPDVGHVGLMIGGQARDILYDPFVAWLNDCNGG